MESETTETATKRFKPNIMEENECGGDGNGVGEEGMTNEMASEQMDIEIACILEKMESFTQLVSELLESGKALLKELSNEFEERMISIHKEQMEKWQEEIKELRSLDASNEEFNALLHNARYFLENIHSDT
ncbi:hypothetical protein RJ641_016382 [Dillenia turbinata]|uniref:Knotted 1-binding protein 36 n=1 Tax=Dillenia turbinata TaxID=194707 RepID=A0AAN8ULZ4_9MAGN